jgi:hypothetical protein
MRNKLALVPRSQPLPYDSYDSPDPRVHHSQSPPVVLRFRAVVENQEYRSALMNFNRGKKTTAPKIALWLR